VKEMNMAKRVSINGRQFQLPASDETVERAVIGAIAAKKSYDQAADTFNGFKALLVEIAQERRGTLNTVSLDGVPGGTRAKVRFTQSVSYDAADLEAARELLGDEAFFALFSEVHGYKALKALQRFLREPGNQAAKNAITKATRVTDAAPKLTFEEGEADGKA